MKHSNMQRHIMLIAAFTTELARWIEPIYLHKMPTEPFTFITQKLIKFAPCSIRDSSCELSVLHHALNIQVFYAQYPVAIG